MTASYSTSFPDGVGAIWSGCGGMEGWRDTFRGRVRIALRHGSAERCTMPASVMQEGFKKTLLPIPFSSVDVIVQPSRYRPAELIVTGPDGRDPR